MKKGCPGNRIRACKAFCFLPPLPPLPCDEFKMKQVWEGREGRRCAGDESFKLSQMLAHARQC